MAAQCAAENVEHPQYLLRLAELELIERHQRMVERRIRAARFPGVESLNRFDRRMDRGLRLRTSHRCPAGPAHPPSPHPGVPRQAFLPIPVASTRSVTEISALEIVHRKRQYGQVASVSRNVCRPCVDQLAGHDASPFLHPPLRRPHVNSAETLRLSLLQPLQ